MLRIGRMAWIAVVLGASATTACASYSSTFLPIVQDHCEKDAQGVACGNLGDHYMRISSTAMLKSWGLDVDRDKAREAYLKACDRGWGLGCRRLVELQLIDDPQRLEVIRAKAIELNAPPRSQAEIAAEIAEERQRAAKLDAELAKDATTASDILGATATALGQQARVPGVDAKTAKVLRDAAKVTNTAAAVARSLEGLDNPPKPASAGSAGDTAPPPPAPQGPAGAAIVTPVVATPAAGALDVQSLDTPECRGDATCRFNLDRCKGNDLPACKNIAFGYQQGVFGLPKDPARAAAVYEMTCKADPKQGCFDLGVMLGDGKGVPRDRPRGTELLKRSCEAGKLSSACAILAMWGETDWAYARLRAQCEAGDWSGCSSLLSDAKQKAFAIARLKALCSGGDSAACSFSASMATHDPDFR